MQFAWHEEKRRANVAKHGIDFIDMQVMFDGRLRLDLESSHVEERRFLSIALLDSVFFTVVWTARDEDTVRIISARRSRGEEKRKYRQLHG